MFRKSVFFYHEKKNEFRVMLTQKDSYHFPKEHSSWYRTLNED